MSAAQKLQFVRTMSYLETENKRELDTEVAKNTKKAASASNYVWRISVTFVFCEVLISEMMHMLSSGLYI
jgi:hypothetical protein